MKIVFLHGIGDGDPGMSWLDGLNRGLVAHGREPIAASDVLAPQYATFLSTDEWTAKMPAPNTEPKDNTAARHAFQRRKARIRRSLEGRDDIRTFGSIGYHRVPDPVLHVGQAAAIGCGTTFLNLDQVGRYVGDEALRGAVLRHVLAQLPSGAHDLVLIGHSLGSLIAIDLLDHLPDRFRVRRFLTLGSPAGSPVLHRNGNRMARRFPYSRVDDWTNVLDVRDVVTGGRGLASIFAAAQDVVVDIRGQHGAGLYLGHGAVSGLIAEVLYPSKALVPISVHLTVRMSDDDANNLLTLHYAHAVADAIKDQAVAERYRGALAQVQDDLIDATERFVRKTGRAVPPEIGDLLEGRLPTLPDRWGLRELVARLMVLSSTNLVEPYDIDTGRAQRDAMRRVLGRLGYEDMTPVIGRSLDKVRAHVSKKGGVPWGTIIPIAVGAALIAAVPLGLAAVGTAGLAGAAATTSTLAAFGPGGMMGGVATIGTLASGGTAAATYGMLSGGGSVPTALGANALVLEVAVEYACKQLELEVDETLWFRITTAESHVAAEIRRHEEFSDPKSARLVELRAVHAIVSSLLEFLTTHDLTPREITQTPSLVRLEA